MDDHDPGHRKNLMVSNTNSNRLSLTEALKLRQQTGELLDRLIADREFSERRAAEAGKRDPMKSITGRTALDSAIASARDMLDQMDSIVAKLRNQLDATSAASKPASRPVIRTGPKLLLKSQSKAATVSAP